MKRAHNVSASDAPPLTNGCAVAAILSAGIGCFVLALLAILADNSALVRRSLVFYEPTGPLSGVTTLAVTVWLLSWGILDWRWRKKTVPAGRVSAIALTLLVLSLILTFPPVRDLF